jgi:quercetin dioxygenase-like cupin family protein
MKKLVILHTDEVEPHHDYPATGLRWSKVLSPSDYALWLYLVELDAGGEISWATDHGEEALYVFEGELDVGGHACPAGGAVIVESAVAATVRAITPTRLAHYGSRAATAPAAGGCVHVVGPRGIAAVGDPATVAARFFADATCPTCRLSLFEVTREHQRDGRPHSHSADEIIYITGGTMILGAYELGPGTSLCIPGGVRYAEGSGVNGCVFLNFRAEASDRTDFVKDGPPVRTLESAPSSPDLRREEDVIDVVFG